VLTDDSLSLLDHAKVSIDVKKSSNKIFKNVKNVKKRDKNKKRL